MTKQTKTLKNNINECLLVIDFGSQVTQLIARRLRELSVYSKIYPFQNINQKLLKELSPKAIIFSGGPRSVLDRNSPKVSKFIYKLGIPILGICYGQQLLMFQLGGKINSKEKKSEFGRAFIVQKRKSKFLDGLFKKDLEEVWMSHGDHVSEMAPNFKVLATSKNAPFAVVADEKRNFYGVQFHPEVHHTPKGKVLFENLDTKIKSVEKNLTDDLNENSNTKYKEYSNGIKILFELLLGFLIGGFLGYYIDKMLATMPVFLLVGIFLGGISGIYTIWKKNIYDKKSTILVLS